MAARLFMTYFKYNVPYSSRFSHIKNICTKQHKLYENPTKLNSQINTNFIKYGRNIVTDAAIPFHKSYEICTLIVQSKGYILRNNFQNLIENLESTSPSAVSMEQSLFLLKSCGDSLPTLTTSERINFFKRIWSYLRDNNILQQNHYLMALKVLELNHTSFTEIENYINESDMIMGPEIYEGLIGLACTNGNINLATEILSKMKEKQIPITEKIFNYLILGHSRSKNVSGCESVLHLMRAANLKPSVETKFQLLRAYIENASLQDFEKLFDECSSENVIFTVQQIRDMVESAANYNVGIINKLITMLPSDLVQSEKVPAVFQNLCIKLIYEQNIDRAFDILNSFPGPNLEGRDIDKFGFFFINQLIQYKTEPSKVIDVCSKLSIKNPRSLHVACEIILRVNPNEAVTYFEALANVEPLRAHYFWPIFLTSWKEKGEMGIINTLQLMKSLNVELDDETFSLHCLPNIPILLKDVIKAMSTFTSTGVKASEILVPTIAYLVQSKKLDQIPDLINTYPSKINLHQLIRPMAILTLQLNSTTDYNNYAKLISSLSQASDDPAFDFGGQCLIEVVASPQKKRINVNSFISIVKELFANNVKISPIAADVVLQYLMKNDEQNVKEVHDMKEVLSKMNNKNLGLSSSEMNTSNIKQPRDMNLDELECHLVELESKNLNTRGVLRKLLQMCVREQKLERALEVLESCEKLKVNLSGGMLASIFDLYIKLKDLDNATKTYERMQELYPNFNLDAFKIIDFLTLMVEKGQLSNAKKFISEYKKNENTVSKKYLDKNVWKLLAETAKFSSTIGSSENEAKIVFNLLRDLGYCDYENVLYGPIIRECLLKNNLKDAVKEFKEFSERFKKTPLQFELMSLLVRVSNGNDEDIYQLSSTEAKILLQDVVKVSCSIHGAHANSSFLLAIAESGTEEQIRKLLINPEFKFNQNTLLKNVEQLSATGKTEKILRMAKAARGLQHLNEQLLYNTLLDNFRKDNNYSGALELFEKLETEDDLKISQEFLKGLVDLLKMNNIQVPTTVAVKLRN